jgi:hypothetical protein
MKVKPFCDLSSSQHTHSSNAARSPKSSHGQSQSKAQTADKSKNKNKKGTSAEQTGTLGRSNGGTDGANGLAGDKDRDRDKDKDRDDQSGSGLHGAEKRDQ